MDDKPREGDSTDGKSTLALVPQNIELEIKEWTNGELNVRVIVTTQNGRYRIEFGYLEFITFSLRVMEMTTELVRHKQKGR